MPITKATASSVAPAAKGDLVVGSATNDAAVLGVGTNDQVLTADSSTATGLKWAAAGGGGSNWSLLNAGGTSLSGAATITVSGISNADKIMILVQSASTSGSNDFAFRFNTDTGSNYYRFGGIFTAESSAAAIVSSLGGVGTYLTFARGAGSSSDAAGFCLISGCNSSGVKVFNLGGGSTSSGLNSGQNGHLLGGYYNSASTISSVSVFSSSTNFDAGTVYVYTSA
jgi:hypothetical protein